MPACLIIHGFTGGPYELEPLADFIKENTEWEVVTPRLTGHGLEDGTKLDLEDVSYKDWIKDAEEAYFSLKEKHQEIFLVGFSMGGMIATYLAAKYTCEKLILLSASRRYISITRISIDILGFAQKAMRKKLKEDRLYRHYKSKYGKVPIKAIREFLKCMKYTKPYLRKIKCPVFIAQGMQDGIVPYKTVHYLDKEIPIESEIIYFHDSKHLICLGEDKDIVIEAVYQFLIKKESAHYQSSSE